MACYWQQPILGGIQVLVQIAHDYFHIRIILYHPVIGLHAVRRIPAARTAPACTEIQNEMLGIQFPVPLFKFAVFKHVSLSLHLLRHRAGRHGRPFCNRLADNFLVFLQPCAIFIGKLFQRHRNGLFSRRHQFDGLHIQGYWTGFHRTARILLVQVRREGSSATPEESAQQREDPIMNVDANKIHQDENFIHIMLIYYFLSSMSRS